MPTMVTPGASDSLTRFSPLWVLPGSASQINQVHRSPALRSSWTTLRHAGVSDASLTLSRPTPKLGADWPLFQNTWRIHVLLTTHCLPHAQVIALLSFLHTQQPNKTKSIQVLPLLKTLLRVSHHI